MWSVWRVRSRGVRTRWVLGEPAIKIVFRARRVLSQTCIRVRVVGVCQPSGPEPSDRHSPECAEQRGRTVSFAPPAPSLWIVRWRVRGHSRVLGRRPSFLAVLSSTRLSVFRIVEPSFVEFRPRCGGCKLALFFSPCEVGLPCAWCRRSGCSEERSRTDVLAVATSGRSLVLCRNAGSWMTTFWEARSRRRSAHRCGTCELSSSSWSMLLLLMLFALAGRWDGEVVSIAALSANGRSMIVNNVDT